MFYDDYVEMFYCKDKASKISCNNGQVFYYLLGKLGVFTVLQFQIRGF